MMPALMMADMARARKLAEDQRVREAEAGRQLDEFERTLEEALEAAMTAQPEEPFDESAAYERGWEAGYDVGKGELMPRLILTRQALYKLGRAIEEATAGGMEVNSAIQIAAADARPLTVAPV